jgi:hypothetical protein
MPLLPLCLSLLHVIETQPGIKLAWKKHGCTLSHSMLILYLLNTHHLLTTHHTQPLVSHFPHLLSLNLTLAALLVALNHKQSNE